MFRVRLERNWNFITTFFGDIELTATLPLHEADALICEFNPTPALFEHRGPAAWYASEPLENPLVGVGRLKPWQESRARLAPWQFMHHAHPDLRFRMPCFTHHRAGLTLADAASRKRIAVAITSHQVGSISKLSTEIRLRTRLITQPQVELYGKRETWESHRATRWSWPRAPKNYRGPLPGAWGSMQKIAFMSQFHASVCLENTFEPYYFTEKLVDVARAGCVPIYHAHPTVRETFLRGCRWVDPADFAFDPQRTLAFALAADRQTYAAANRAWLLSPAIARTCWDAVFERICVTLREIAAGRLSTPAA